MTGVGHVREATSRKSGKRADPGPADVPTDRVLALGTLGAVEVGLADQGADPAGSAGDLGAGVGDQGIAVIYGDAWGVEVAGAGGEQEGGEGMVNLGITPLRRIALVAE